MSQYPQHDKITELEREHDILQQFVDHARNEGWQLCRYVEEFKDDVTGWREDGFFLPANDREIGSLIAAVLGIDEDAFNAEKEAMYQEIRRHAEQRAKETVT